MGLTNLQYDRIRREYDRRQIQNRAQQEERIRHAFSHVVGLREMEEAIAELSYRRAEALLQGNHEKEKKLEKQLAQTREEKAMLLSLAGFSPDYMDIQYHCPLCKDTGYIQSEKCRCFRQAVLDQVFAQYAVRDCLEKENFSTFSFAYFDREVSRGETCSSYENMRHIHDACLLFAEDFEPGKQNLLFRGQSGTGKTFVSHCIAEMLLKQGYSVIYLSAIQFFDELADRFFSRDREGSEETDAYLLESDLLILDDLGTELNNSFVNSRLFACISERNLRKKSTIISTNLSLNEIRDRYTERVSSRLLENYQLFHFYNSDIRVKKRLLKGDHPHD